MDVNRLRVLFMGMNGVFSQIPFSGLLNSPHQVVGLVVPFPDLRDASPRPIAFASKQPRPGMLDLIPRESTLLELAMEHEIPAYEVGELLHPDAVALLERLAPDVVCVACFPRLLPPEWFAYPDLGAVNLHPSLLPAYRGPEPLFWQFRNGEENTGITLHFMDQGVDTGDIAAQEEVVFPNGVSSIEVDRLLAQAGAGLLLRALRSPNNIPRTPQMPDRASYQPFPGPEDRAIPTTWSARRAYNFICGASRWGPFQIETGGRTFIIHQAKGFIPDLELGGLYRYEEGHLMIQFNPGVLDV